MKVHTLFIAGMWIVDPVWSYPDPNPPNLLKADLDPGQKITKFFKKSKIILNFKSEPKP